MNWWDLFYIGVSVAFFVSCWGFIKLCEILSNDK
jgi:hypothetical protein